MRSQFDSDHRVDFYPPRCCLSATFVPPLFAFVLYFVRQKIFINNVTFRHILRCLRCIFRIDVATVLRQIRLIARCRGECGNVEWSEGTVSEGRCKRPSEVQGGAPEQKYVSKMTHGFFVTINSMILFQTHHTHW